MQESSNLYPVHIEFGILIGYVSFIDGRWAGKAGSDVFDLSDARGPRDAQNMMRSQWNAHVEFERVNDI